MAASLGLAGFRRFSVAYREIILVARVSNSCRLCSGSSEGRPKSDGGITRVQHHRGYEVPEGTIKRPGVIRRYLLDRVVEFIGASTDRLEKVFPKVFQIYKTFKSGLSGFVKDSREYYTISKVLWSGTSLKDLSRHQLELLRSVPQDFVRILPVLCLAVIPGGSGAFPIVYVFPRLLLSYHFWTEEQRHEFWQKELGHRLEHLQPTLDHMNLVSTHLDDIEDEAKVMKIIRKLRHTVHPTVSEVENLLPLYEKSLYNLDRLSITYMRHLAKTMKMSVLRRKLKYDAMLLHYTDLAMLREGFEKMTDFELERACFRRGLNPINLSRKERVAYLGHWTDISKNINEHNVSLLLHLPLFFGFWQPTNRELMGSPRFRIRMPRL